MTRKAFHISKLKPSVFQGRFDFETVSKRRTSVLAVEHPAERIAAVVFAALFAVLLCAYFYFVIASVFNVIGEKQADARSADLQGTIASLEQQYFSLSQSLSPQEATALGLAPITNIAYVYRPGNAAAVTSPIHAI